MHTNTVCQVIFISYSTSCFAINTKSSRHPEFFIAGIRSNFIIICHNRPCIHQLWMYACLTVFITYVQVIYDSFVTLIIFPIPTANTRNRTLPIHVSNQISMMNIICEQLRSQRSKISKVAKGFPQVFLMHT